MGVCPPGLSVVALIRRLVSRVDGDDEGLGGDEGRRARRQELFRHAYSILLGRTQTETLDVDEDERDEFVALRVTTTILSRQQTMQSSSQASRLRNLCNQFKGCEAVDLAEVDAPLDCHNTIPLKSHAAILSVLLHLEGSVPTSFNSSVPQHCPADDRSNNLEGPLSRPQSAEGMYEEANDWVPKKLLQVPTEMNMSRWTDFYDMEPESTIHQPSREPDTGWRPNLDFKAHRRQAAFSGEPNGGCQGFNNDSDVHEPSWLGRLPFDMQPGYGTCFGADDVGSDQTVAGIGLGVGQLDLGTGQASPRSPAPKRFKHGDDAEPTLGTFEHPMPLGSNHDSSGILGLVLGAEGQHEEKQLAWLATHALLGVLPAIHFFETGRVGSEYLRPAGLSHLMWKIC
ncbi:unnamed protein product, partial [Ostreobium quekettii]